MQGNDYRAPMPRPHLWGAATGVRTERFFPSSKATIKKETEWHFIVLRYEAYRVENSCIEIYETNYGRNNSRRACLFGSRCPCFSPQKLLQVS